MRRSTTTAVLAIGLFGVVGCTGGNSDYKKTAELKKAPAVHDDHEHGEAGPHHGSLVELGKEEFHAEVVLDHDAHTLRVFVLGKDAKTAQTTTATEITLTPNGKEALKLKAAPVEGDGEGKTSRFELVDEAVVHELLDAGAIHGELRITIGSTPFSGDVDYHLDDVHHEHKDAMPPEGSAKDKASETSKEPEGK